MSDLYTLFSTRDDRDLSRAAAERYYQLQSLSTNPSPARRSSRRGFRRIARTGKA